MDVRIFCSCFLTHWSMINLIRSGADTGGVDRVDIHPPFFSKKRIRNVTLFEIENKERKKNELSLMSGCCYATFRRLPPLFAQKFARKPFDNA